MFAVRTRTHPHTLCDKSQRGRKTKNKEDKKTEILARNEKTKKIVSFLFKFSCSCLLFAVECCWVLCAVCDRSGGVHCTLNCSSLTQSHRHLDQGKEGYLLYGLRKEPSCNAPHIHRDGISTRNMGQVHIGGCAANQNVSGHRYSIMIFQTMTS
jgi:hypothetical protein